MLDFSNQKVQKKLKSIEQMVKQVYDEQIVTTKDLGIRDRVINKIKNAFLEAKEKDYPK